MAQQETWRAGFGRILVIGTLGSVAYLSYETYGALDYALAHLGVTAFGISFFAYHWKAWRIRRLSTVDFDRVDTMKGDQFEHFLAGLMRAKGYDVELTPYVGDYGADLVLKERGKKIVVQAKRYQSSVGVKAVQEIIPAMNVYGADEAWVVTNSYFTKQALTLAKANRVKMVDRPLLKKRVQSVQSK